MFRPVHPCPRYVPVGPSPGVLTWPARVETGVDLSLSFLGDQLEAVVVDALQADTVQKELKNTIVDIMEDPAVTDSIRPYLIEASLLLGLGIAGGIALGRAVSRRMS